MTKLSKAMIRAADWLEAHPEAHIGGVLATKSNGWPTSTRSPNAACWCALGRMAYELGLDVSGTDMLEHLTYLRNLTLSSIWFPNDQGIAQGDKSVGIAALRQVAATLTEE